MSPNFKHQTPKDQRKSTLETNNPHRNTIF